MQGYGYQQDGLDFCKNSNEEGSNVSSIDFDIPSISRWEKK